MYLGVDWGTKRIGLAVGSEIPYELATIKNDQAAVEKIAKLCIEEKIERIVIGMPILESGGKGNMADKVEDFGRELKEIIGLPIYFEPENLTTQTALELLKEEGVNQEDVEKKVDQTAARLILEQYIANREEDISQEAL
jgi:putative holliday junction resolvase